MSTQRHIATYTLGNDLAFWKEKLLIWVHKYDLSVYLDSNNHSSIGDWECLAAVDAIQVLEMPAGSAFFALKKLQTETQDWLFGFLSYDLKNEVEHLASTHPDGIGFPDLAFFQPKTVAGIRNGQLEIHTLHTEPEAIFAGIKNAQFHPTSLNRPGELTPRIPRADYLNTVGHIRQHIIEGDVYEMNFCQEFFAENMDIDPLLTFKRLNKIGQAPATAYVRWRDRYALCASPERFLRKQGDQLFSQPIKGTRPRGGTPFDDENIKQELFTNEKDRAENVMIVDLVRNDLARHCEPGSIQVPELFGIHTFATVHQMISTVCGTLRADTHPVDALRDAFPMGSMTGAPKVMAMQLIEQYERTRRGLYSGAIGYFTPNGDFDFNVLIRSILYNQTTRYASVQVGGAIVYDSVPEEEYEECLVKLAAMRRVLSAEV